MLITFSTALWWQLDYLITCNYSSNRLYPSAALVVKLPVLEMALEELNKTYRTTIRKRDLQESYPLELDSSGMVTTLLQGGPVVIPGIESPGNLKI